MNVGDAVTHPDYPSFTGVIDRLVYVGKTQYYKVTWPWRASPGPEILYSVSAHLLKKA